MPEHKLQKWGHIAGFQKKIIDVTNTMIIDHHRKTLSDAHSGSIFRSTVFILTELFGEYLADIIKEFFSIDVNLKSSIIKVYKDREDERKPVRSNYVETKIVREKEKDDLKKDVADSITIGLEKSKRKRFLETKDIRVEAEYEIKYSRSKSSNGYKGKLIEIFKEISQIMLQVLEIINKECIEIAYKNQKVRENILRAAHTAIFETSKNYLDFFKELVESAELRFNEANDLLGENSKLQIMLFLPIEIRNTVKKYNGLFFYPFFNVYEEEPEIESDGFGASLNTIRNNIDRLMLELFYQKELSALNVTESKYREMVENIRRSSDSERGKIEKVLKSFIKDFFNEPLLEKLKTENMDIDISTWSADNIYAILQIFHQYKAEFEKVSRSGRRTVGTELHDFFKNYLVIDAKVLSNIFSTVEKKVEESKKNFEENYVEIDIWDLSESFDNMDFLPVYQPSGQGVVGTVIDQFIPLRTSDQKIESLNFSKRMGIPYNIMGFLESRFSIGGGNLPVTMSPLTSKGQLLGALYAVKYKRAVRFSSYEMNTLEFISQYIAEKIQEAKDNYVFRSLVECVSNLDSETGRIEAIFKFISCIAILTNVVRVDVEKIDELSEVAGVIGEEEKTISDRRVPTFLSRKNAEDFLTFFIPPETWNVNLENEYWVIQIKYFESFDVIDNYKYEIERLYRMVLHALGLKASGVESPGDNESSPEEKIFEEIGFYIDDLGTQASVASLSKEELKETHTNSRSLINYSKKAEHNQSCGLTCNTIVGKMGYDDVYKEKAKSFSDCVACWWSLAETMQNPGKLKKIIRPRTLSLTKGKDDWKSIVVAISHEVEKEGG